MTTEREMNLFQWMVETYSLHPRGADRVLALAVSPDCGMVRPTMRFVALLTSEDLVDMQRARHATSIRWHE